MDHLEERALLHYGDAQKLYRYMRNKNRAHTNNSSGILTLEFNKFGHKVVSTFTYCPILEYGTKHEHVGHATEKFEMICANNHREVRNERRLDIKRGISYDPNRYSINNFLDVSCDKEFDLTHPIINILLNGDSDNMVIGTRKKDINSFLYANFFNDYSTNSESSLCVLCEREIVDRLLEEGTNSIKFNFLVLNNHKYGKLSIFNNFSNSIATIHVNGKLINDKKYTDDLNRAFCPGEFSETYVLRYLDLFSNLGFSARASMQGMKTRLEKDPEFKERFSEKVKSMGELPNYLQTENRKHKHRGGARKHGGAMR